MPLENRSLLDTRSLQAADIYSIFKKADKLALPDHRPIARYGEKVAMCVFFEPSTRTLMSFQMAAARLGISVLVMLAIYRRTHYKV